jgi:hypothetical protein
MHINNKLEPVIIRNTLFFLLKIPYFNSNVLQWSHIKEFMDKH